MHPCTYACAQTNCRHIGSITLERVINAPQPVTTRFEPGIGQQFVLPPEYALDLEALSPQQRSSSRVSAERVYYPAVVQLRAGGVQEQVHSEQTYLNLAAADGSTPKVLQQRVEVRLCLTFVVLFVLFLSPATRPPTLSIRMPRSAPSASLSVSSTAWPPPPTSRSAWCACLPPTTSWCSRAAICACVWNAPTCSGGGRRLASVPSADKVGVMHTKINPGHQVTCRLRLVNLN